MLAIEDLVPTPDNPRKVHDPKQEEQLAVSVKLDGVLQPVLVRPHPKLKGKFDMRAGGRRLAAARAAGLESIPCIVKQMDDEEALRVTVVENLQREDLTPMESALALGTLQQKGWQDADIAEQIGKSPGWVARRRQLLKLSAHWQKTLMQPKETVSQWPVGHLELVASISPNAQAAILKIYKEHRGWAREEVPTRASIERQIGDFLRALKHARWDLSDAELLPEARACSECLKRTSAQPLLFEQFLAKGGDRCLDPECWASKKAVYVSHRAQELTLEHGADLVLVTDSSTGQRSPVKGKQTEKASWDVHECPKSAKGAFPCLKVTGNDAGRLFYATSSGQAAAASRRGKAGPTSLADRRIKLKGRRAKVVIAYVLEQLKKDTKLRSCPELVRLAAVFGTERGYSTPATGQTWKSFQEEADAGSKCKTARRWLWDRVKPVLAGRLSYYDVADAAKTLPEVAKLCHYLGLHYGAILADASAKIPEPKAWAKLNEDGSPKQAKAKKAKKAKEVKAADDRS